MSVVYFWPWPLFRYHFLRPTPSPCFWWERRPGLLTFELRIILNIPPYTATIVISIAMLPIFDLLPFGLCWGTLSSFPGGTSKLRCQLVITGLVLLIRVQQTHSSRSSLILCRLMNIKENPGFLFCFLFCPLQLRGESCESWRWFKRQRLGSLSWPWTYEANI